MKIKFYKKKEWDSNDYLLDKYLNNIEDGLKNISKSYYKPYGWKDGKTWEQGMSFSYLDVNRWIDNLKLIEEKLNNESNELYPNDNLYPSDTLLPH